ncbi:NAD(P)-binding protein [Xylona heveae TC161]|uniref:NAD(P)-binding protein n=1 Tax=Xylona heveae (strain CBS 132557 / TC161) TaxID=1328760 RepID=A0A165HV55_XYLHT|nr:NAD(P)-binding protein [Xylona heveae TC161]KZF23963.1 NAD(P)-binding protein [Xylona heveae TC161]
MANQKVLNVGFIGLGEVAQVIHLPTLSLLNHLYRVVAVCDISAQTVKFCQERHHIPKGSTNPSDIFNDPSVDIVFILTSDEFHAPYTIAALGAGKHVLLEKPITLSLPSAQAILDAEQRALQKSGNRVFVGYMRRYAPSFVNAFKREVAGIDKILYARSRDIVGPNPHFVSQSGTFPVKYTDFPRGSKESSTTRLNALLQEAFDGKPVTEERKNYCRFLGSLGSHDLSLMREALGFPESVAGVSAHEPFYSAIFNYTGPRGEKYAVTYESGIDKVPRFDAHLTVYGENKTVSIKYDTPYVKGLPIKVTVDELNEFGEATSREILSSYEDAYTAELKEMYECLVNGKEIKTTVQDAIHDLKLFDLMYTQLERQKSVPPVKASL